ALHGVSLVVPEGAVVALIGANGAGKSTLLRAISGIVRPRRGAVRFSGEDLVGLPVHQIVRRRVIHVPEGRGMLARMTVLENLRIGGVGPRARAGPSAGRGRLFRTVSVPAGRRPRPGAGPRGGRAAVARRARDRPGDDVRPGPLDAGRAVPRPGAPGRA